MKQSQQPIIAFRLHHVEAVTGTLNEYAAQGYRLRSMSAGGTNGETLWFVMANDGQNNDVQVKYAAFRAHSVPDANEHLKNLADEDYGVIATSSGGGNGDVLWAVLARARQPQRAVGGGNPL